MIRHSRPRLAVFDCDGTLVDSQHVIVTCMNAAFAAEGLGPPAPEAVRRVIGLPLGECMARLAPGESGSRHDRLAALYKGEFQAIRERSGPVEPLFEGAREALDALEAAGFVLGIATGKARRGIDAVLDKLGLARRFVTVQTSDVAPGKPNPAMLERAMAETGVGPAGTVMVGDTTYDMQMALSAGVFAVGVGWGYHPPHELKAAGAHALVERFDELSQAINGFGWRDACA